MATALRCSGGPPSSVSEHVPHLLRSATESLQGAADLGHLPKLLNLREGVSQRDCLAVRLSQKILVTAEEPTPDSRPATTAADAVGSIYADLKNPSQRYDTGLRDDSEGDAG